MGANPPRRSLAGCGNEERLRGDFFFFVCSEFVLGRGVNKEQWKIIGLARWLQNRASGLPPWSTAISFGSRACQYCLLSRADGSPRWLASGQLECGV
jgi:hypothetical protein